MRRDRSPIAAARGPARSKPGGSPTPLAALLARRTKIVATIGPASRSEPVLRRLLAAGMDVARLNFSHAARAEHGLTIRKLRAVARDAGVPLTILQDLQGPKIRVGRLAKPLRLQEGAEVVLTTRHRGGDGRIPIPFPGLVRLVRPGGRIMLRDGMIELAVLRRAGDEIHCRVVRGGTLGQHQGVNIPGARIRVPSLTRKDAADLRYGLRHGVDCVALSFVRRAEDVRRARRVMRRLGRIVPIIAKLEKAEAIGNLDAIIAEADAVMVARGDLGVELPPEQVPLIQKQILRSANEQGIAAITATQMLESMVRQRRPTRAETSDVANAILDGTDAVMLSEETAAGRYPVEAVQMMARIARAAESGVPRRSGTGGTRLGFAQALASATVALAADLGIDLLVALTASGRTARLLSPLRPPAPILAVTEDERAARYLNLYWGVRTLVRPLRRPTEELVSSIDRDLVQLGAARAGDRIVMIGSMPIAARGRTNFVQLHRVGGRGTG